MSNLIFLAIYIIIGFGVVTASCHYADVKITDIEDLTVYIAMGFVWPAIIICGFILAIVDLFDDFGDGPSCFA